MIAGQSASMLTSFSVCREDWGGRALPLLLNGSLSLEFQSEKDTAEGKRAIEEVITLQLFDEKKTQSRAICNKKSEAKPSGVTVREPQEMGGAGEREEREEGNPAGSEKRS